MTADSDEATLRLRAFGTLDLDRFEGLSPGTALRHLEAAFGPSDAGVSGRLGYDTIWFRVYPLPPRDRLSAWFEDDTVDQVLYVERAVDPEIREWIDARPSEHHRPKSSRWVVALPARGLAFLYSPRSRLPVLVYGFVPMSNEEFDQTHLAFLG